ncbi:MAG: dynamin family protein [Actinomycetota bacterium]|nr:dynamin family protein [Actinomycetota bacterium]
MEQPPPVGLVLVDALVQLRDRLQSARLDLSIGGIQRARHVRNELVAQIDDYLLPRLRQIDAPLLAVVGGSTGAGKSTLVNSLVGNELSPAGVLRPTTRAPVLVCYPGDARWFMDERILPGLPRATGKFAADGRSLHLVTDPDVPQGLALLDAPDIDSVVATNRALAGELLAAADLWIFVTTAARYADAVPWDLLHQAETRSTALAVVLNRVPAEALEEVPQHLQEMLDEHGLERAPLFAIAESSLDDGLVPVEELEPLRDWLNELASDADARAEVVRMTLEGALDSIEGRVLEVAGALEAQAAEGEALRAAITSAYSSARRDIEEGLSGGTLLRGEVLIRWQEFVGTGEFMRALEDRIGWLRDRVREVFSGEPPVAKQVQEAVGGNIGALVRNAADTAAERVVETWRAAPAGRGILERDDPTLGRASDRLSTGIEREVRAWQQHVLELVRAEGASKRAVGRMLSLGVNVVGASLMVAVFAQTGGLTGGEVVIAGGTATVSQKILEAVFGDQAVRSLTSQARRDLLLRIDGLLDAEAARFEIGLGASVPPPEQSGDLREALDSVERART